MTTFDTIYQKLLKDIMTNGIEETNIRTGHKTKAIPGAHFSIDIEKDGFPILTLRKNPMRFLLLNKFGLFQAQENLRTFFGHLQRSGMTSLIQEM
jgi:thymidylate synthase